MCIALISTAHPAYQLILIDNRDEFLNRPTAPASWWPAPNSHVLAGRDLLRSTHGTWLGVTSSGQIAVLTNFRENGPPAQGVVSRGAIINAFLTQKAGTGTESFVKELVGSGAGKDVGGFSLACGKIGEPLAIVSNRAVTEEDIPWIAKDRGETVGLSNGGFRDRSWRKVLQGEELMQKAIDDNVARSGSEDDLLKSFLDLLSVDTLPIQVNGGGLETHINYLRETIFVPPVGRKDLSSLRGDEIAAARKNERAEVLQQPGGSPLPALGSSGPYGTQKQTVVLASHSGKVRFFERTLYDDDTNPIPAGQGDLDFTFSTTT